MEALFVGAGTIIQAIGPWMAIALAIGAPVAVGSIVSKLTFGSYALHRNKYILVSTLTIAALLFLVVSISVVVLGQWG
ncbi:hypothetical protein ACJJI5_17425 [Microbulbifer sp. EKSA008]|uniref:hypothetical protein n=1 Tax=unclassified Microbulbifer TaxID=2619833 RepID=UPI002B2E731B|nr:hypothetical protein QT397_10220 [Microbulbifer sp. MKSA007]